MIRVVFGGPKLNGFPPGREGGSCKLMIREMHETKDAFIARLEDGWTNSVLLRRLGIQDATDA